MPRRIAVMLAFSGAAAGLVWAGWPGVPGSLATVMRRIDVVAAVVMLAGLPWLARRVFGPAGRGRAAPMMRLAGYAVLFTLVLVKAEAERFAYAGLSGPSWLAGAWAGEILFLVVLALYLAALLASTARRPPVALAPLMIGTSAGVAVGLILYALPPVGGPLHPVGAWLDVYDAARVVAVLLIVGVILVAAVAAARGAAGPDSALRLADAPVRRGLAAGLCAGAAAAVVFSVLDLTTIALVPGELNHLQWALSGRHLSPGAIFQFEMSLTDTAAGHLLALVLFPLLGAGVGAWGGLYAEDRGQLPGGGGGGGGRRPPTPPPAPPGAGQYPGSAPRAAILRGGYLVDLPDGAGLSPRSPDEHAAPHEPDRIPVSRA